MTLEKPPVYLYVEDDAMSRKVMSIMMDRVIENAGYHLFENSDNFVVRLEALDPQPTVFLLDIHLRPLNGFEILKELRNHPTYLRSTVIALTASVMSDEIKELRDAGFDGVLGKPLDAVSLAAVFTRIAAGERIWNVN